MSETDDPSVVMPSVQDTGIDAELFAYAETLLTGTGLGVFDVLDLAARSQTSPAEPDSLAAALFAGWASGDHPLPLQPVQPGVSEPTTTETRRNLP